MKNININELVAKVNIVDIISNFSTLTKSGASFKTLCNVHGDTTPSLSINPRKQIYKCFVCDHGGNALDYLIWAQKFSWNEAIEYLIKESGENIEDYSSLVKKTRWNEQQLKLINVLKDANDLFNYYLNIYIDEQNEISEFIKKRNLSKEVINKFKLGYIPRIEEQNYIDLLIKKNNDVVSLINASILSYDGVHPFLSHRLIFPIFDEENNIIAFSGRSIENDSKMPKYINSKESLIFRKNSTIYNYQRAKNFETIIIVEGFMDVIAFSRINLDNAIALMGVALSKENINRLKKHKEILIFLDSDQAGITATLKIIQEFIKNEINAFVVTNSENKDPDEIVNEENGKAKLLNLLSQKTSMVDFIIETWTKDVTKDDFVKLKTSLIDLNKYSQTFDQLIILEIINKIANKFHLEKEIISKYFVSKVNVVKFRNLKDNRNNTITDIENELNEPLNINKLLISIWQNPSFLESQKIEKIKWPTAWLSKIFREIKDFHYKKIPLSAETIDFLNQKLKKFPSKSSLPKTLENFDELITRTYSDTKKSKLHYIDKLIETTNNLEHKKKLISQKMEIISKEGKND